MLRSTWNAWDSFKNDLFQWFRVDSFFWETMTLYMVHFQIENLAGCFHSLNCVTHEGSFSKIHNRGTLNSYIYIHIYSAMIHSIDKVTVMTLIMLQTFLNKLSFDIFIHKIIINKSWKKSVSTLIIINVSWTANLNDIWRIMWHWRL